MDDAAALQISARTNRTAQPGALLAPVERAAGDSAEAMTCAAIFEELCVNANGDIVCSSCDVNGRWVYGNVHTDRIADVYNGTLYREMRAWQLASRPDSWCPAINYQCPRRCTPAEPDGRVDDRKVRLLKLEPTTHCNLDCPVCPVITNFVDDEGLRETRGKKILAVEAMLDVVAQLPDLEMILYFNFGEPFLHKGTVAFLRELKRLRPEVRVVTNTNGLILTPAQIEALAGEALMHRIVFSIDGAFPESYARYRVRGDLDKALAKMRALAEARKAAGTEDRLLISWQYILFEWNDSDAEIAEAKRLARDIGVPLEWVITSGYGASQRYLSGSAAAAELHDPPNAFIHLAAPAELADRLSPRGIEHFQTYETYSAGCEVLSLPPDAAFQRHPNPLVRAWRRLGRGAYAARFASSVSEIAAPAGSSIEFKVDIACKAPRGWTAGRRDLIRLGARVRDLQTGKIVEVVHDPNLIGSLRWGRSQAGEIKLTLPARQGRYELIIDLVREHVSWFYEQGSTPLTIPLRLT